METTIVNAHPVLPVANLPASLRFYIDVLGFKQDFATPGMASVSRNGCCIMLDALRPEAGAAWAWIGVSDDTVFTAWRERGVSVIQSPQNHPWAYEMKFADPDGNTLWVATAAKPELPFE